MKKAVKFAALIMALLMVFACVGCAQATDQEKMVGKWTFELDFTDFVNGNMEDSLETMGEFAKDFEVDEYILYLEIVFNEDGTYKLELDEKESKEFIDDYAEKVSEAYEKMLEKVVIAQTGATTLEEALVAAGKTKAEYNEMVAENVKKVVDEFVGMQEDEIENIADECDIEGKYEAKDGKLYLTDDVDDSADKDDYVEYQLSENALKLTNPAKDSILADLQDAITGGDDYNSFPWELKR